MRQFRDSLDPRDLQIDAAQIARATPEELRSWAVNQRIFVSSVMSLGEERKAVIEAITSVGAMPIVWESIVPAPIAPDEAWLGGVRSSTMLIALLSRDYGIRRTTGYSATHEEFLEAERRGIDRRVFLDAHAAGARDGHLETWLRELRALYSYGTYDTPADLADAVRRLLAGHAAYRLYTWIKIGRLIFRADTHTLEAPGASWTNQRGTLHLEGHIADPEIRAALAGMSTRHDPLAVVVDGQLFEGKVDPLIERSIRGRSGYAATVQLDAPAVEGVMSGAAYSVQGRTWSPLDIAEATARQILGLAAEAAPWGASTAIDWRSIVERTGALPELIAVVGELVATQALLQAGAFSRITAFEVGLVGPPRAISLRVAGIQAAHFGTAASALKVEGTVPLA